MNEHEVVGLITDWLPNRGPVACEVEDCSREFEDAAAYFSHLRAHVRSGRISHGEYAEAKANFDQEGLTAPQREVVAWRVLGLEYGEIAERMGITYSTARAHIERAAEALGLSSTHIVPLWAVAYIRNEVVHRGIREVLEGR